MPAMLSPARRSVLVVVATLAATTTVVAACGSSDDAAAPHVTTTAGGAAALRRATDGAGPLGDALDAIERWARGAADYAALTAAHAAFGARARPAPDQAAASLGQAVYVLFRGAAALPADAVWDPVPPSDRPGGGHGHGAVGQALFTRHDQAPFTGPAAARDAWLAERLRAECDWLRTEQLPLAALLEAVTEGPEPAACAPPVAERGGA